MVQAALKNILVLDGHRASEVVGALSLIQQDPNDRASTNPFADSCEPIAKKHTLSHRERIRPLDRGRGKRFTGEDPPAHESIRQLSEQEAIEGPQELADRAVIRHPALRTRDGMQLYCFRDRLSYGPENSAYADPNRVDPNHLEYWIRRLEEQLVAGEKLDAVIIPSEIGPMQYSRIEPLLTRIKDTNTDVKIIQLSEKELPSQPLVDHQLIAERLSRLGDTIRDLLEVPQLPKATAADMANLNLEDARLRKLAQGTKIADLPPWLKRQGDPGYVPPGEGGKPGGKRGRS